MNGADILCDTLLANEIDVCFANPGTSEMHFVAALDRKPAMRCVLGLFEGVVTGAADGYARMAGKPAATLMHLGPGLVNGLANLHNARRAYSPVVNIVGDHPSYHLVHDAPLTSDIEGLARPMSGWVGRVQDVNDVSPAAAAAISAARSSPGQVATLILPADAAWNEAGGPIAQARISTPSRVDHVRVRAAADALKQGGRSMLMLSAGGLREGALRSASRIAGATGTGLIAQQSNGRMERGAGRVPVDRVPYNLDRALATFAGVQRVILAGARAPVAFFAYPGKPGSVLPEDCEVIELAGPGDDIAEALEQLAEMTGAPRALELPASPLLPLASGALTPDAIIRAVARYLPANAILCDETISAGRDFFGPTFGAAPHDFLQNTGGAIGVGLPMAAGAALACPDRKVVALQADGSAMYTPQALWTHARERLDVLTIIFSNRKYAILQNELKMVGGGDLGRNAMRMLNLDDPELDWVALAQSMGVEAARSDDAAGFNDLLQAAMGRRGPFLIEARI
ncbi:acetolactate synthase large subunit [Lacisediminimonas profundi]|uniref:acetolactate synthase large subunit n=1 Tax=Lacisediminimonas profundi TaxID=2603856 RepID=UPI00124B8A36|nr:acetolactate synthase large subunit [Lacisediminimonas profundi]